MIKAALLIAGIWIVLAPPGVADAQATSPSTQPAAPHKLEVPTGFHILRVGERLALCEPQNDPWVEEVMTSVPPTTRPTTMPSDIIQTLDKNRDQLTTTILADMALKDSKPVDQLIDDRLLVELQRMVLLKPTVYFFVATREKVADLMADGWSDPQFHYIRFSHNVAYSNEARLAVDVPMDDLVWWVEIHDGDNPATLKDKLALEIKYFEAGLANELAGFSRSEVEHLFVNSIHKQVMEPLDLPGKIQWFDFAVSNIFAIKYSAMACGADRQDWTEQLIGTPDQPRPWARADLVNALDPSEVRPQYLEAYDRALLFKGAVVVNSWVTKGGDGVVAKVLPLMRAHTPRTPLELIKQVKDSTGIDLTPDMKPDYSGPALQSQPQD
jgi:hypothetical protein